MVFGQLVEYNMKKTFSWKFTHKYGGENWYTNMVEKVASDSLLNNQN